jgi:lipopolysaccharide transport system permease protein
MRLNPLMHLVEMYRDIILNQKIPERGGMIYFALSSIIFFFIGFYIFQKTKKDFSDII